MLVCEDVWGEPLAALADRYDIARRPQLWSDRPELLRAVGATRALVVRNRTSVDAELLHAGRRLEIVARAGVGLDNIDLPAADRSGIVVVAALGANATSVAEHALALALGLVRDIAGHDRRTRAGRWDRLVGTELRGLTWGVVGIGATGRATASLARGFGMDVVGFDPYLRATAAPAPLTRLDRLEQLLSTSHVVSLHLPANAETAGMVDASFLAGMRSDALLINVARGSLVDEDALADALESGVIAGAALDVRAEEPPSPGRLEKQDNVLLSPHVAGLTNQAQGAVAAMLAEDLASVLGGGVASRAVGAHRVPTKAKAN